MQRSSVQNAHYNTELEKFVYKRFTNLFSRMRGPIGIACSGGSDSVALLYLMAGWQKQNRHCELIVLTVDHGLRTDSYQQSQFVIELARTLGLRAFLLFWKGKKPKTGIQKHARIARYKLMSQAILACGGTILVTAHTLNDQIETGMMRFSSSKKWQGMAAMQMINACPVWPEGYGVAIYRPLLDIKRFCLRTYLRDNNINWVEDLSNTNPVFERVRWRKRLANWSSEFNFKSETFLDFLQKINFLKRYEEKIILYFLTEQISFTSYIENAEEKTRPIQKQRNLNISRIRQFLMYQIKLYSAFNQSLSLSSRETCRDFFSQLINLKQEFRSFFHFNGIEYYQEGYFILSKNWLYKTPVSVNESILAVLISCVSGQMRVPSSKSISNLARKLRTDSDFKGATLNGARISFWQQNWILCRDSAPLFNPFLGDYTKRYSNNQNDKANLSRPDLISSCQSIFQEKFKQDYLPIQYMLSNKKQNRNIDKHTLSSLKGNIVSNEEIHHQNNNVFILGNYSKIKNNFLMKQSCIIERKALQNLTQEIIQKHTYEYPKKTSNQQIHLVYKQDECRVFIWDGRFFNWHFFKTDPCFSFDRICKNAVA